LELVDFNLEVTGDGGKHIDVPSRCGNLERLHALTARLDVDHLPGLHPEGWPVYKLAVHKNVTVHHHLAGLSCRAGKTGAHHESVKTHLKEFHKVLTAQTLRFTSFLKGAAQLGFTDAVLGTKALLLAKTNGVVAVGLALSATVLAGSVGTLF
jgi:hypothetical protein